MKHYAVRSTKKGTFYREGKIVQFFPDKEAAKLKRKELNGTDEENNEVFVNGWVVTTKEIV